MRWQVFFFVLFTSFAALKTPFLCAEEKEVVLNLSEPILIDGVLSTERGGVLCAPGFRLQAQRISYTQKKVGDIPICYVEAEGNLMLELNDSVFLGKKLFYDLHQHCGIIEEARGGREPWFFGAQKIALCPDGSYQLLNGYFTTSEEVDPEWKFGVGAARLSRTKNLLAQRVRLQIGPATVFWFPRIRLNLASWLDTPIKYRVYLGGRGGTRVGFTYEVFSWNRWKTYLRMDYRLQRGLGGGLETNFHSDDGQTDIHMINYAARDTAPSQPGEKIRYRFQGLVHHRNFCDKLKVDVSWDKISDRDMPSDYCDKGIEIKTAEPTQMIVQWQERYWITSLVAVARFNNFQTINQELPTIATTFLPAVWKKTGIVMNNHMRWSFLDFKYANQLASVSDYRSTRFEYRPLLYRPFFLGSFVFTPRLGGVAIHYGNGPERHYRWVVLGSMGAEVFTELSRRYGPMKHLIQPYIDYAYLTFPTTNPDDHFIFDITDGWYRLDQFRFGVRNVLLGWQEGYGLRRLIDADVFANAFFDTPTIRGTIPKVYGRITYQGFPNIRLIGGSAWNFSFGQLDHVNLRTEWTASDDFALSCEYRHRSSWDWRKADHTNFILDSFRSEQDLRDSILSDRRDTFLIDCFYRFLPMWAISLKARHGWNRLTEPAYNEYEIDLFTTFRSCWHVRLSYQHKEDEKRFAVYLTVKLDRPARAACAKRLACFE